MIALLPMKRHSERLPNKNIKVLDGKPLFFHIMDTLLRTHLFQLVAINTDSEEISCLATQKYGSFVKIIERPVELVGDTVSMNEIIKHDISLLGYTNHYFQTHSTTPLLSSKTIQNAVDLYWQVNSEERSISVFAVTALQTRLYDKNLNPINHSLDQLVRTQDLDVIYEENSNFYIFSGQCFQETGRRIGKYFEPFVLNRNSIECIDIDSLDDWQLVRTILESGFSNEK